MAVIGAILGDIAGFQYEGRRCRDYRGCDIFTDRCSFTDDTVTTLSVKYAIDGDIPFVEAFKEIGRRYPNCGYAQMYEKWVFSDSVEPYGSWGNGSAMRCFYESDSYESFLRNVFSLSCDCDTLCCIGGGVAEEFYKGTGFDAMKLRCQILYTKNLFALQERKRHVIIRSRKQSL